MFSAPGEGLETAEIARRILALADRKGDRVRPDGDSAAKPGPLSAGDRRGAAAGGIPAYFSRGTARPDPAGRAFLGAAEVRGGELLGVELRGISVAWAGAGSRSVRRSGSAPRMRC